MSCRYCNQKTPLAVQAVTTSSLPSLEDLPLENTTPKLVFEEDRLEHFKNDYQRDLVRYFQGLTQKTNGLPTVMQWLENPALLSEIRNKSAFAKILTIYGQPVVTWAENNMFAGENGATRSIARYILSSCKAPSDYVEFVWQQTEKKPPVTLSADVLADVCYKLGQLQIQNSPDYPLYATRFFHLSHSKTGYSEDRKIAQFIEAQISTNQIQMGDYDRKKLIDHLIKYGNHLREALFKFLEDLPLPLLKNEQFRLQTAFAQSQPHGFRENSADRFLALKMRRLAPNVNYTAEHVATALLATKEEQLPELLANLLPAQLDECLPLLAERLKKHDLSFSRITMLIRSFKKEHFKQSKKIDGFVAEIATALPPTKKLDFFAPLMADFWYRNQAPAQAAPYWRNHVQAALQNQVLPTTLVIMSPEPAAQQILRTEYQKLLPTLSQQPPQKQAEILCNAFMLAKNCQDWALMDEMWPTFAPHIFSVEKQTEGLFPQGKNGEPPEFFDFFMRKITAPPKNKKEELLFKKIGRVFLEKQPQMAFKYKYPLSQRQQARSYFYELLEGGDAKKKEKVKENLLLLPPHPRTTKLALNILQTPQNKKSQLPIYAVEYLLRKANNPT